MEEKKDCPCEAVKHLQKIVEGHDKQLNNGNVQFAVINTKLNVVIGVMGTIGVALCGVIVKMLF
jgi:DNA transposition AAA+ family ATPase